MTVHFNLNNHRTSVPTCANHHYYRRQRQTAFVSVLSFTPSTRNGPKLNDKSISTCHPVPLYRTQRQRHPKTKPLLSMANSSDSMKPNATLQESNVLVVGGGPVGSLAAAMLNHRGIPTTLIEKSETFLSFNVSISFALGLYSRGMDAIKSVPGLFDHIKSSCSPGSIFRRISPTKSISINYAPPSLGEIQFFMRFRLLHLLKTFVTDYTDTTTMYGTEVVHIDFEQSGNMNVHVKNIRNDRIEIIKTKMILACDGRNSIVVEELKKNNKIVTSTKGFELNERSSPAVGMYNKSIIVDNVSAFDSYGLNNTSFEGHVTIVEGLRENRSWNDQFGIGIFPTEPDDIIHLGGVLGVIVRPAENSIWKLNNTEQAFRHFQENFPQLDIRKCISAGSMQKFVNQRPGRFPTIARPQSLSAKIGTSGTNGAVIILGEAAHCFPPDTGQGVNAGLDDVATLMRVIDKCHTLNDICETYEKERDGDLWALMKIAQVASPYQYRQSRIGFGLQIFNYLLRKSLNERFPSVFHPSLAAMLNDVIPYRQMLRLADLTTGRILIGFTAPFVLIVVYFLMSHQ